MKLMKLKGKFENFESRRLLDYSMDDIIKRALEVFEEKVK